MFYINGNIKHLVPQIKEKQALEAEVEHIPVRDKCTLFGC